MVARINNQFDKKFWEENYQSYKTLLDDLKTKVANSSMPVEPKTSLTSLINKLLDFANTQFQFFLNGFAKDLLEESEDQPQAYVMQKILDQISNDLIVLEQIADDWDSGVKQNPLKQATVLANNAFELAYNNNFLTKAATAFIYLHKTPVVRVIPYANAALIGIPYTAVNPKTVNGTTSRSLLAIPHEIGHFVFWNGHYDGTSIREYLVNSLRAEHLGGYMHWLEEIFADVYSAYVGGAVTAQSIQDILQDNQPIFFDLDDGTHPPNVIRPHIYAYADAVNGQAIIAEWEGVLVERGIKKAFKRARVTFDNNRRVQSLTFDEIPFGDNEVLDGRKIVEKLVELVAAIFTKNNQNARWANGPLGQAAYDELTDKINDLEHPLHIGNFKNGNVSWNLQSAQVYDAVVEARDQLEARIDKGETIPPNDWLPVFLAAGWTNGGEEDGYHTIE